MSKCRPEAAFEFAAIADFLRSVHVNGKPLELPENIDALHVHPRLSLNMARAVATPAFERTAAAFDVAEAAAASPAAATAAAPAEVQVDIRQKLAQLDERLDTILRRLEGNQ